MNVSIDHRPHEIRLQSDVGINSTAISRRTRFGV